MISIGAWWVISPKRLNQAGIDLIKSYEGWSATIYKDVAGYPTIGYGHLVLEHETFPTSISRDEGEALLRADVKRFEDGVNKYVEVPLTQNMFNALVSFSYNVGVNAFSQSTLLRKLNAGDYIGANNELSRWDKAGGQQVKGLAVRRLDEQKEFFS